MLQRLRERLGRLKEYKKSLPGLLLTLLGILSFLWNQALPMIQNVEWLYEKSKKMPIPSLGWSVLILVVGLAWLAVVALWPERESKKDFAGPFLTLDFPNNDLMSTEIRTDYLFIENLGQRAALDIEVRDISKEWKGNKYSARFPPLQVLKGGHRGPVTPTVYRNGESHPVLSVNSRIWFCALLVGEDIDLQYGEERSHPVSISYSDQGVKKTNSMEIVAKWYPHGVLVSVRNQA